MIIAICSTLKNLVIPRIGIDLSGLFAPMMVFIIIIGGLLIALGAVGVHISGNIGSTLLAGIMRAIGYTCNLIIQGIKWIIVQIYKACPKVFKASRKVIEQVIHNRIVSNILAAIVTILFVAVII